MYHVCLIINCLHFLTNKRTNFKNLDSYIMKHVSLCPNYVLLLSRLTVPVAINIFRDGGRTMPPISYYYYTITTLSFDCHVTFASHDNNNDNRVKRVILTWFYKFKTILAFPRAISLVLQAIRDNELLGL